MDIFLESEDHQPERLPEPPAATANTADKMNPSTRDNAFYSVEYMKGGEEIAPGPGSVAQGHNLQVEDSDTVVVCNAAADDGAMPADDGAMPAGQWNCTLCTQRFAARSPLYEHYASAHFREKILKICRKSSGLCPYCPEVYASKERFLVHVSLQHEIVEAILNPALPGGSRPF